MKLIDTLRPVIEAALIQDLIVDEDAQTGQILLDRHITIETEDRQMKGLFGPMTQTVYVVSFFVYTPPTRDEPEGGDVVEVGTYASPVEAVGAALGVVINHRISDYMDRLADNAQAEAWVNTP